MVTESRSAATQQVGRFSVVSATFEVSINMIACMSIHHKNALKGARCIEVALRRRSATKQRAKKLRLGVLVVPQEL